MHAFYVRNKIFSGVHPYLTLNQMFLFHKELVSSYVNPMPSVSLLEYIQENTCKQSNFVLNIIIPVYQDNRRTLYTMRNKRCSELLINCYVLLK